MKMKLLETYNFSVTQFPKKDGTMGTFAYIDPKKSTDDTMRVKDALKNFGARWDSIRKVWGWYLSGDQAKLQVQLQKMVYPAIEYLNSQETAPEGQDPRTAEQMKNEFNGLLGEIEKVINTPIGQPEPDTTPCMDEGTLKTRLEQFKQELVNSMSSEDFLAKLEPIIKFKNAQGHQLSLLNALLIWVQNPKAKMVKARTTWRDIYHKEVKPGARALAVWVPVTYEKQGDKRQAYFRVQKATEEFLASINKRSEAELTPGEKDKLRVIKKQARTNGSIKTFKLEYRYYDIADTVQIQGTEDVVGSMEGLDDIEWTDRTSEPTDMTVKIYDAMTQIIQEYGINLTYVDDLGGAMGVSKSGSIDVLKNSNKNAGAANTLIHEFSHEILHQKYLKAYNGGKNDWAKYFIGTQQGRSVVEQQAELCAYLVLRFFDIKLQQSLNYIAIWGADAKKASIVFDTVAKVANDIADKIAKKLGINTLSEDGEDNQFYTGLDVAELLGQQAVKVYNYSKQCQINQIAEDFKKFYDRITTNLL